MGFPLENNYVSYYNPEDQIFVQCGLDPIGEDILIEKEDYFDR